MNYQKIYNDLIKTRKKRSTKTVEYYEKHHIIPRTLGGNNEAENLVSLTAREHYLCHWLLTKIYPDNPNIWVSFALMSGRLSPKATREFSAKAYERCKHAQSIATKLRFKQGFNPGASEKSRKAAKDRMNNRNPIKQNPGKNWTARGTIVYFDDGSEQSFDYGKLGADSLGIPYATWKWALKNTGGKIPKYGITQIIQAEPKVANNKFRNCEG